MSCCYSVYNKMFNFSTPGKTEKKTSAPINWSVNSDSDTTAYYAIITVIVLVLNAYSYIAYVVVRNTDNNVYRYHISNNQMQFYYNIPQPASFYNYIDFTLTDYNKQTKKLYRTLKRQSTEHVDDHILMDHYLRRYTGNSKRQYNAILYMPMDTVDDMLVHYNRICQLLNVEFIEYNPQEVIDTVNAWLSTLNQYLLVISMQSYLIKSNQLSEYWLRQPTNAHIIYYQQYKPHTQSSNLCAHTVSRQSALQYNNASRLCELFDNNVQSSSIAAATIELSGMSEHQYVLGSSDSDFTTQQYMIHLALHRINAIDPKSSSIAKLILNIAQQLNSTVIHIDTIHKYATHCDQLLPTAHRITRQFDNVRAIRRLSVLKLLQYNTLTQYITFHRSLLQSIPTADYNHLRQCMINTTVSMVSSTSFVPTYTSMLFSNVYGYAYTRQPTLQLVELPLIIELSNSDQITINHFISHTSDTQVVDTKYLVNAINTYNIVLRYVMNVLSESLSETTDGSIILILKFLLMNAYNVQHDNKQVDVVISVLNNLLNDSELHLYLSTIQFNNKPYNNTVSIEQSDDGLLNRHMNVAASTCQAAEEFLDSIHQSYDNVTSTRIETTQLLFDYTQLAQHCALNQQYDLSRLIHTALYQLEKHLYTAASTQIAVRTFYIAQVQYTNKQYSHALTTIEQSITTHSFVYGMNTLHSAYTNLLYARIYRQQNKYYNAIDKYQLAIDNIKHNLGSLHPSLLLIYEEIVVLAEQHRLSDIMYTTYNQAYELIRLVYGSQSELAQNWRRNGTSAAKNIQLYHMQQAKHVQHNKEL